MLRMRTMVFHVLRRQLCSCTTQQLMSVRDVNRDAPPGARLLRKKWRARVEASDSEIVMHDGVLVVPNRLPVNPQLWRTTFEFPGFATWFNRSAPIHLELCTGFGQWLVRQASKRPEWNWVGIDGKLDRIVYAHARAKHARCMSSIRLLCGKAEVCLDLFIPPKSLTAVYINFPDPWGKKRHHKRRLLQDCMIQCLSNKIKPGGMLVTATDDEENHEFMLRGLCAASNEFHSILPDPYYTHEMEEYEERNGENVGYQTMWTCAP